MFKLFITLVLLVVVFESKIIAKSDISDNIVFPANGKPVYVSTLNNNIYKDVIPGVKWIWHNNGLNTPTKDRVIMEIISGPIVLEK